ncbi:hypothetical protein [uncultured Fusobacterium sp.]|uniref:hypothetical protein n=1 Tax=uncultured Fusobacterium sp. TaxID=159267 RepID=UPI0025D97D14|nr:hypothetical protein [uncultured Fusobacterium sp.]
MKDLKKILFYLMIILTFTISFSNEENRITIYERENEPAKLKIGVTKLITKELAMDFDPEKKIIYCEVPEEVTENDSIYVSETLDEIPSTSTTNGRKTINNINKYLTKDVKANANFNYRVIDVNDEATGEVKKYLVINCKNPVTSVYLYIVENGTYKMKGLYRGVFATLYKVIKDEYVNYGIIRFLSNNDLIDGDRITSTTGANIVIKRGQIIEQSQDKDTGVVKPLSDKGFPKKYAPGAMGYSRSKVKITLGTGIEAETKELDFSFKDGLYDLTLPINSDNTRAKHEQIRIYTEENSDYITIQLQNWDNKFSSLNLPITIQYLAKEYLVSSDEEVKKIDFTLMIDPKNEAQSINNKSSIKINPTIDFNKEFATLEYDGKTIKVKNEPVNYIDLGGNYLERFESSKVANLEIISNDKIIMKDIPVTTTGVFKATPIGLYGTENNEKIGILEIIGEEKEKYLKYNIRIDKPYSDTTMNNLILRYYDKYNNILKVDELQLLIYPEKEDELKETIGGIYIKNANGLNRAILTTENDSTITLVADEDKAKFDTNNGTIIGNFPEKVIIDQSGNQKIEWGSAQRVVIYNESLNNAKQGEFSIGEGGNFSTPFDEKDGIILSDEEDHSDAPWPREVVRIGIKSVSKKEKKYLHIEIYDYRLEATTVLNKTLRLEYQAKIGDTWVTKKTDKLKVIIQPLRMGGSEPEIHIKNPIVWYDYSKTNMKDGINHVRRVKLLGNEAKTLERGGTPFIKNTDLKGNEWIKVENIPEYTWFNRHKIEISAASGNAIKYTDDKGKTKSSTFVKLKSPNQVMFAYDGNGDKSLSFGVSEYNFAGGEGQVIVTQYNAKDEIDKIQEYNIKVDKFSGIHYVDDTQDIKPRKDYIKSYAFNKDMDIKPVEIEYGNVGFRNLDTRITEQSGGKGIELRATREVTLVGQGEYSQYKIPATLYFKNEGQKYEEENVAGTNYTIIKGKNEIKTSAKLCLYIDSQEYLIPKAQFKIVEAKDESKSPLRVGVVVNGDKTTYFEEVADLYLDMTTQRFVRTELIFTNESIQSDADNGLGSGEMEWIRLDNNENSNGVIPNYVGKNWGIVKGEVINIPTNKYSTKDDYILGENEKIKIEVYDGDYRNKLLDNLDSNPYDIKVGENIFQIAYFGDKYFSFRVNNRDSFSYQSGESTKFYLRFSVIDSTKPDGENEKYLFTQEYTVKFTDGTGTIGDTKVILKNPMMYMSDSNSDNYGIKVSRKIADGDAIGIGNEDTKQDQQKWWDVERPLDYPDTDNYKYTLYSDENCGQELKDTEGIVVKFKKDSVEAKYSNLIVGLNKNYKDFSKKQEKIIYIKWKSTKDSNWERKDKVTVIIEQFDPTYYGKVYPTKEDDISANNYKVINKAGDGYKVLDKNELKPDYLIDLGTTYRDYQRFEGVVNIIDQELVVKGVKNIVAKAPNGKEILGKIMFKRSGDLAGYADEAIVILNKDGITPLDAPEQYKLYFLIDPVEYNKLEYNTKYELFEKVQVDGKDEKNILQIGLKNELSEPFVKRLQLEKPLNFRTSKDPFVIETGVLDFGKINILFNHGRDIIKTADTWVKVTGENIKKVELTLEKGNINEDGKVVTEIYKMNDAGYDENIKLKVNNLILEKLLSEEGKAEETKSYKLSGALIVPLDSKVGDYRGVIYINSTIIAN